MPVLPAIASSASYPRGSGRSRTPGRRHRATCALSAVLLATTGLGAAVALSPAASAVSTDIVISEVYGGGGNSGATLTNDFVELYNLSDATVDLSQWSV